jgi:hypothetical protein
LPDCGPEYLSIPPKSYTWCRRSAPRAISPPRKKRKSSFATRAAVLIVSSSDAPRECTAVAGFEVAGYFKKPSEHVNFLKLGALVQDLLKEPDPTQPRS